MRVSGSRVSGPGFFFDRVRLLEPLHHNCRGIGNLFARLHQNPLANQFRHQEPLRLVRKLFFRKLPLALGQNGHQLVHQPLQSISFLAEIGIDLSETACSYESC